jgi:hypothetical protein
MSYMFDLGTSTKCKYVDVVCDVLCDKNKFFGKYISYNNFRNLDVC